MIDKMVSGVLVIVTVVLLGILLYTTVFSGFASEQTVARHKYEQAYGNLLIRSILLSHDEESLLSYDSLLAQSLQELDEVIQANDRQVNVTERFAYMLDGTLGPDNYYMTVEPIRKGVAVSYVLDGSSTMDPKRETVDERLSDLNISLHQTFGENATVYVKIYLLTNDEGMCAQFTQGVACEILPETVLYPALESRGFDPPYPAPYYSYMSWAVTTHSADLQHMADSDWASGVAYASYAYQEDTYVRSLTNKHIIVVVADELTTTSKSDACFGLQDDIDYLFCSLCASACPWERAERIVNQTVEVLGRNGDLLIAFQSTVWDYTYNEELNDAYLTNYTCRFIDEPRCHVFNRNNDWDDLLNRGWNAVGDGEDDTPRPPANVNWCAQQACGGCDPPRNNGEQYGFHRNCDGNVSAHLEMLASVNSTGDPMLYPLTDATLMQLTDRVAEYLNEEVARFNFTLGVRDERRDRYVFKEDIPLVDGQEVKVTLWIYDTQG